MLSLPRTPPISRPGSVLTFSSTCSAISTRACHGGSSYGSRAEQERSCHQEDQRKAGAKSKNPARCSVVLALGGAAARRLKLSKDSLATRQDHTVPCGVLSTTSSPAATPTAEMYHGFGKSARGAWAVHIKQCGFEQHLESGPRR